MQHRQPSRGDGIWVRDGHTGLDQERTKPNLYPEAEPHLQFCFFNFEKETWFSHVLLPFALFIADKNLSFASLFPVLLTSQGFIHLLPELHSDMEMAGTLRTAC